MSTFVQVWLEVGLEVQAGLQRPSRSLGFWKLSPTKCLSKGEPERGANHMLGDLSFDHLICFFSLVGDGSFPVVGTPV